MLWCLISASILVALLGLAALIVHPLRLRPSKLRLGLLFRGCLASMLLLVALGLGALALLAAR
jgi:hypothetical protein